MFSLNIIWQQVLNKITDYLKSSNQDSSYLNFLDGCKLEELDEHQAIVSTPYNFNKIILNNNLSLINESFNYVLQKDISCHIETVDDYQKKTIESTIEKDLNDNLIPEFTFDNFVVGPSNVEARTAAFTCANSPGKKELNPLVIYGDSGLGKTHLLSAIGNYVKVHDQDKKILYISSTSLVTEVIKSFNDGTIEEYKNQLNSVDILLVDDIQSLSGKTKTNEVFFSIYNELFNNNKQIVLTCDRPPIEIKEIEERLKTRFSQGLSVTIKSLENETAYRILQLKLKNHNIDQNIVQPEVIAFIAKNYSSDVRALEGALNRLLFYSINFSKSDIIDLDLALEAFKGQQTNRSLQDNQLNSKVIVKAVTNYYGLTEKQLTSKVRTKNLATARHIAMYLCRKHLDESFLKIGEYFGGRDHSTVLSACEKIDELVKTNKDYKKVIADIENSFV